MNPTRPAVFYSDRITGDADGRGAMNGIHDLGPVVAEPNEPVFHKETDQAA
jgi:hypothetical protein